MKKPSKFAAASINPDTRFLNSDDIAELLDGLGFEPKKVQDEEKDRIKQLVQSILCEHAALTQLLDRQPRPRQVANELTPIKTGTRTPTDASIGIERLRANCPGR
jgi:phosphoketolase